jgi:hypothetical protein
VCVCVCAIVQLHRTPWPAAVSSSEIARPLLEVSQEGCRGAEQRRVVLNSSARRKERCAALRAHSPRDLTDAKLEHPPANPSPLQVGCGGHAAQSPLRVQWAKSARVFARVWLTHKPRSTDESSRVVVAVSITTACCCHRVSVRNQPSESV